MVATDIRRVTPEDVVYPGSERSKLAIQAREKLGYGRLASVINSKGVLMDTLVKLDILPLHMPSVEKYKKSKERSTMWSAHVWAIWTAAAALVLATAMAGCMSAMHHTEAYTFARIMAMTGTIVFMGCGCLCLLMSLIGLFGDSRGTRLTWSWNKVGLRAYNRPVPDFVLNKAVQIAEVLPQAIFCVDYLHATEERAEIVDPDPFLTVIVDKEEYYIDVWDEREFEDTL